MDEQSSTPESKNPSLKSLIAALPPKFAFWAGIVAATAVISVIGFIVMLVIVLGGADLGSKSKTSGTTTNSNVNAAANTNSAPSGTIDKSVLRNVTGKGKLTIVEFSDLDCPYCKTFHATMQQAMKDYEGKVAWSYNHFPLSIHPGAQGAAEASECAAEQGKFWEFTDDHFANQSTNLTAAQHADIAATLGLNKDKFQKCLDSKDTQAVVASDAALAQQLGAQGTPFSVIIDEDRNIVGSIPGALPLAQVKTTLDSLLK